MYSQYLLEHPFNHVHMFHITSVHEGPLFSYPHIGQWVSELGALMLDTLYCIFHKEMVFPLSSPRIYPQGNFWVSHEPTYSFTNILSKRRENCTLSTSEYQILSICKELNPWGKHWGYLLLYWCNQEDKRSLLRDSASFSVIDRQVLLPQTGWGPLFTRAQATSTASVQEVSVLDICKAATWSSMHVFMKHYASSADAAVRTAILQASVPPAYSHTPPVWILLTNHPCVEYT